MSMIETYHCAAAGGTSVLPPPLRTWVLSAAAHGMTSVQARAWLAASGWTAAVIDAAALELERASGSTWQPDGPPPPPDRAHQHSFAYSVMFVAVGLTALAAGSTVHLLLESAHRTQAGSRATADWLTIFACSVPFAVVALRVVAGIEERDPMARLSRTRESLATVLLWSAGIIGGLRLIAFVHQLFTALVVSRDTSMLVRDLIHVATVVGITGAVFMWAWCLRYATPTPRDGDETSG